jgi:hypothetical protein
MMATPNPRELARLRRLLAASRRGLNHDLTNQLVALQGLLQLLEQDEADHLGPAGKDYIRRLVSVGRATQALARTLRDLARLGGELPVDEIVALPELVEEAVAALNPTPACIYSWDAPRTYAPRPLLQQAVTQALSLLAEVGEPRAEVLSLEPVANELLLRSLGTLSYSWLARSRRRNRLGPWPPRRLPGKACHRFI